MVYARIKELIAAQPLPADGRIANGGWYMGEYGDCDVVVGVVGADDGNDVLVGSQLQVSVGCADVGTGGVLNLNGDILAKNAACSIDLFHDQLQSVGGVASFFGSVLCHKTTILAAYKTVKTIIDTTKTFFILKLLS